MNISLTGKKILIAGATGAIGKALAQAAHQAGAEVAGSFHTDEETACQLEALGIRMTRADLTQRTQAEALVHWAIEPWGYLDALVYAAGNIRDGLFLRLTEDQWADVLRLHLDGLAACCRAVLPCMQKRGQGKLVAFGSMAGRSGRAGQTHYSAAKAATVGFMKSLAKEVGRFGITTHVICPGFTDSKMTRSASPQAWERAKADSALGMLGSTDVVASFAIWLLSDWCKGVTGQVFHLDSRVG